MNILVENSEHSLLNMGDIAMLQVAVQRLSATFPRATLHVLTNDTARLARLCPGATPLLASGSEMLFDDGSLLWRFARLAPGLEYRLRMLAPRPIMSLVRGKARLSGRDVRQLDAFVSVLRSADLVIGTGGGYLTDTFPGKARAVLAMLDLAHRVGKPTALIGQGIGPIHDPAIRRLARAVVPNVQIISLREAKTSLPVLDSLGVPRERIVATGDDAVELAYSERPSMLGNGMGINLRLASYAGIGEGIPDRLRAVLHEAARRFGARMVPVPISFHRNGNDASAIADLLRGQDAMSDGGRNLETPLQVIREVSRCRIVVTGSYHAAVFALSQGIRVVGLSSSEYYTNKFAGLADQFRTGCETVFMDNSMWERDFESAIQSAWASAEATRPALLDAAKSQIALGLRAYNALPGLLSRCPLDPTAAGPNQITHREPVDMHGAIESRSRAVSP